MGFIMRKLAILILVLVSTLTSAYPVKIMDLIISESIRNVLGPNITINYQQFDVDQTVDIVNKTGYINVIIYPENAVVKPSLFDGIIKGQDTLDVKNHKTITFHSSKIHFTEDSKISSVDGVLLVKNKSTPVTFQINSIECHGDIGTRTCVMDFSAALDRTKLDLNYGLYLGLSKQAPIHLRLTVKE